MDKDVYTMEYYSAIKKNEIMPFAVTWMDLEIIILNEVRQRKTTFFLNFPEWKSRSHARKKFQIESPLIKISKRQLFTKIFVSS